MREDTRIMVVSAGIPHPRIGASLVLFYYYMEAVKEWGGHTQHLLLIQEEHANEEHLSQYMQKFHDESRFEVVPLNLDSSLIQRRGSRITINPDVCSSIVERINRFNPDILICIDLFSAWLAAEAHCGNKVVWLGDLNFQTSWYHALYSFQENRKNVFQSILVLLRAILKCRGWKSVYASVLRKMNVIIVSSKSSEEALRKLGIQSTYLPYPWPNYSECVAESVAPEKPTFLFYGTLKALGSRSSFHFLLHKLYPRIVALWGQGGFRIFIAGRGGLPSWVEEELLSKPEFEYLGFVDDLAAPMKSCHAVLAPIDIPVGNRSRIVTAMANKTLVIAHGSMSLTNPELSDGQTCLLARSVKEFVEKMRYACQRSHQIDEIINRAHDVYMGTFSPDSAKRLFIDHIEKHERMNKGET